MSAPNSTAQTVELPPGVRHHSTSTFAESWEAYDALTAEDGWRETTRYDVETGAPRSWKHGEIRGHSISVHAPRSPRSSRPDRDDNQPVTEAQLAQGYGLAVHADEIARRRRLPHQLREDATGKWPR